MNPVEAIEFRKIRNFSEVLGATFSFYRQNFRKLVPHTLVVMIPFLILIGSFSVFFLDQALTPEASPAIPGDLFDGFWSFMRFYLLLLLAFLFYSVQVFAYIILYMDRGYDQFEPEDVLRLSLRHFGKALGGTIISLIFVGVGAVIFILPAIYVAVPLSLLLIVIYREEIGVFAAISRCFEIVSGHWWVTFGLLVILGLIGNVFSTVLSLPQLILSTLVELNTLEGSSAGWWSYVLVGLNIFTYAGYLLIYAISLIGLAFQYFSLVEQKEMPGLLARIESIEKEEDAAGDLPGGPDQPRGESANG